MVGRGPEPEHGQAPVFTREDGRSFSAIEVQRAFAVARKLSGIRLALTPHSLRHTFASWLAMSGQPLRTIQELPGHSDIRMTVKYAHLSPTHLFRGNAGRWQHGDGDRE